MHFFHSEKSWKTLVNQLNTMLRGIGLLLVAGMHSVLILKLWIIFKELGEWNDDNK